MRIVVAIAVGMLAAGCGGAAPNPDSSKPEEGPASSSAGSESEPSTSVPPATVALGPCKGDRVVWHPGDPLEGVPEDSSVEQRNITGDQELELFVRGPCPQGKPCEFFLYAACGNHTYAKLNGARLFGDGIETTRQGALFGRVYWLDIVVKSVVIVVDNMSEGRSRFRFDGTGYQPYAE